MLKKTVEYEDLNGNVVSEDLYFHFSKAEIVEMQLTNNGHGLLERLVDVLQGIDNITDINPDSAAEIGERIMDKNKNNTMAIVQLIKDFIFSAYGEISDDGRRFIKDPELTKKFAQSEAYSALFMELVNDAQKASMFMNALIPKTAKPMPPKG